MAARGRPFVRGELDAIELQPLSGGPTLMYAVSMERTYGVRVLVAALVVTLAAPLAMAAGWGSGAEIRGDCQEDDGPIGGAPLGGGPVDDGPIGGEAVGGGPVGDAAIGGEAVGGGAVYDAPLDGAAVGGGPVGDAPIGGAPVDDGSYDEP
jgi:hypothetical protein